jgi:hypothetical protein
MKEPIPHSAELLDHVKKALTPNRLPLLIAIDGADGIGKSSLASWLAWQLGMPAIQLDLYLTSLHPIQWLTEDLKRVVDRRLDREGPLIVDGVLVLDALDLIGRKPALVVFVIGGTGIALASQLADYRMRRKLPERADFMIDGHLE